MVTEEFHTVYDCAHFTEKYWMGKRLIIEIFNGRLSILLPIERKVSEQEIESWNFFFQKLFFVSSDKIIVH